MLLSFLFVLCPEYELLLLSQGGLQPPHEKPSQGSRPGQVSRGGGCVIHFVCWLFFVIELGPRVVLSLSPIPIFTRTHFLVFLAFLLLPILYLLYLMEYFIFPLYTRLSTFSFSPFCTFSPSGYRLIPHFFRPQEEGEGVNIDPWQKVVGKFFEGLF